MNYVDVLHAIHRATPANRTLSKADFDLCKRVAQEVIISLEAEREQLKHGRAAVNAALYPPQLPSVVRHLINDPVPVPRHLLKRWRMGLNYEAGDEIRQTFVEEMNQLLVDTRRHGC